MKLQNIYQTFKSTTILRNVSIYPKTKSNTPEDFNPPQNRCLLTQTRNLNLISTMLFLLCLGRPDVFVNQVVIINITVTGASCLSVVRPSLEIKKRITYTLIQNYNYLYNYRDYICYSIVSWNNVPYFTFTTNNYDITHCQKTQRLLYGPATWHPETVFCPTYQFSHNSVNT